MATEQDAFEQLEQHIQRAVSTTVELRAENVRLANENLTLAKDAERLRSEMDGLEIRAQEAEAASDASAQVRQEVQRLEAEVASLHKEREGVRSRVEKLLKQIEALS
jgi:regulator of replication initiation timing